MHDHLLLWTLGLLAGLLAAVAAAIATRVRLLPEVIDVSIILTGAGLGALAFTTYGALRRYDPDRIARLTLGGTVIGVAPGSSPYWWRSPSRYSEASAMLRFMAPYLFLTAVAVIAAGVAYETGAIDVPTLYAALFAAIVVGGLGYARWDARRHPRR